MKNLQQGFIMPLLLAIVAVLVVGGGVYVYKNQKVEKPVVDSGIEQSDQNQQKVDAQTPPVVAKENISNWKIYTNKEYGFDLQYPKEWTHNNSNVTYNTILLMDFSSPDYKDYSTYLGGDFPQTVIEKGGKFSIVVENLSPRLPYTFDQLKKETSEPGKIKEIKVGEERALLIDGVRVYFLHPKNGLLLFKLYLSSAPGEIKYYSSLFNQILSTFKFTDNVGTKTNSIKYVPAETGVTGTLSVTTCGGSVISDESSCRNSIGANQSIVIRDSDGRSQTFTTNSDGTFKIKLKSGQYTSEASSFSYPYTETTISFTVSEYGYTEVNLHHTILAP